MSLLKLFFLQLPCDENTSESMHKNVKLLKFIKSLKLISLLKKINLEITQHFCIICYQVENSIRLHLFQREIEKVYRDDESKNLLPKFLNNLRYIASILLSDDIEIPDIYYYKSNNKCESIIKPFEDTAEYDINPEKQLHVDLEFYYKYYFYNAGDLHLIQEYFDNYSPFINVIENLENLYSGLWFSYNDIRWQLALVSLIYSNYSNFGVNTSRIKTEDFTFGNKLNFYAPNYNSNSSIERDYLKYLSISCDSCGNLANNFFYHNPICGDICSNCYAKKQTYEENQRQYFKKLVLLQGKRVVFKRKLKDTKEYLKTIKIKNLTIKKKNKLIESSVRELSRSNIIQKTECRICLDSLTNTSELKIKGISAGYCGHCFHTKCIENMGANKCPICRKFTHFVGLYLNA